jgi:type IV pilus assembly protein PilW
MMNPPVRDKNEKGITLAEILVGMMVCGILTAVVFPCAVNQNNSYKTQAGITDLQQDVRAAFDFMSRDIRMAGYNPAGASFAGVQYGACSLTVRADLDGNGSISGNDEWIRYWLDTTQHILKRETSAGIQTLAENIQSFSFSLKDSAGTAVISAARQAAIRQIQIAITGRTAHPDRKYKTNNGYRTFALQTLVVPRNLALQ